MNVKEFEQKMASTQIFLHPTTGRIIDGLSVIKDEYKHVLMGYMELYPKFARYDTELLRTAFLEIKAKEPPPKNIAGWLLAYCRGSASTDNKQLPNIDPPSPEFMRLYSILFDKTIKMLKRKQYNLNQYKAFWTNWIDQCDFLEIPAFDLWQKEEIDKILAFEKEQRTHLNKQGGPLKTKGTHKRLNVTSESLKRPERA